MFKKTSIVYSLSSVIKAGVQLLVGLAIAKFVSPEDYGIWGSLNLLLTYAVILQMGIINGVNLELPISIGRGDDSKAEKIVEAGQAHIAICIALVTLCGCLYLVFFGSGLTTKFFWGVSAVIILITMSFYQDFLTATFRTPKSFRRFAYINIAQAVANFITILLIIYFSYYGLIWKSVIVIVIYVILLHLYRPFKVGIKFNKKQWVSLIKVGLPIFALSYLQASALNFDRVLLIRFTNLEMVGIYTFAYLAFSSVTLFSSSVASYIYPTMSHMYAENHNRKELWEYLKKNMTYIFVVLFIIGITGAALSPFVVQNFFPKYIASVSIMQILFIAGIFNGGVIGVNVLLSIKKWNLVIFYHAFFAILLVVCPYVFMHISVDPVKGIAFGVLIANMINFIAAYALVYIGIK